MGEFDHDEIEGDHHYQENDEHDEDFYDSEGEEHLDDDESEDEDNEDTVSMVTNVLNNNIITVYGCFLISNIISNLITLDKLAKCVVQTKM